MKSRTDETLQYIQFLARHLEKSDVRAVAMLILIDLGLSPASEGFDYLRSAIELHRDRTLGTMITSIYLAISALLGDGSSWQYVDQAIRRVIRAAWKVRDLEIWELFFPFSIHRNSTCPPNKEFIARISCFIELWQSCKEAVYE